MMKRCPKCNINKDFDLFHKDKNTKDGFCVYCKLCRSGYYIVRKPKLEIYYLEHRDGILEKNKNYYLIEENRISHSEYHKNYVNQNPEYFTEYNKLYYQEHKEERNAYMIKRYQNNPRFRTANILRSRYYEVTKGKNKSKSILDLIGCTLEEFNNYIELQFLPEMNWENRGKIWEIDHIIPISLFNLDIEEEKEECFHFSNNQPLFKTTKIAESFGYKDIIGNRNKGNK